MWVYRKPDTEDSTVPPDYRGYYQVGYFDPNGTWYIVEVLDNKSEAELEVAFLNGGALHIELEGHLQQIAIELDTLCGILRNRA